MNHLGFEAKANTRLARNVEDHKELPVMGRMGKVPYVFLVVDNIDCSINADPMPVKHMPCSSGAPKPQISMMRSIPCIAFCHLRQDSHIDTELLADIWFTSFERARACFRGISTFNQHMYIERIESGQCVLYEHQKALLRDFSPYIEPICGLTVCQSVPASHDSPGWTLTEPREQMRKLKRQEERYHLRAPCRRNCYVLYAIVHGALYGLCNQACYDGRSPLNQDSEIAFTPDVLYDNGGSKLVDCAMTVGHFLREHYLTLYQWNDLIFEIILGKGTRTTDLCKPYLNPPSL